MKRVAIITGASSGMGREFVLQLDRSMHRLDEIWVVARRVGRLFELEKLTEHKIVACPADLTKPDDLDTMRKLLAKEKPLVAVLVNAAGFGIHGTLEERGEEQALGMVDLNCRALTAMTKICLPYMAKGGRIIQLASSAAFVPQPKFAVYAACKSYVLSFSRALHAELAPKGISVTAVCPGPVDTEFFCHDDCDIRKTGYKKLIMAKADEVVKLALQDAGARRQVSVYGTHIKAFRILAKMLPHHILLAVMRHVL